MKCAKAPSPCRKKRSIGIIRSIECSSVSDGTSPRAISAWRSGRRSIEDVDQRGGVARDVAAVGKDLRLELAVDAVEPGAREALLLRQREADQRDGDGRMHARQAGIAGCRSPSAARLRAAEASERSRDKDRGRRPAGSAATARGRRARAARRRRCPRRSRRPAAGRATASPPRSARALERASGVSAARRCRSQPKECSSRSQSSEGGPMSKGDVAAGLDHMAGKREAAGIDFRGDGRIGGPEIGRRDQKLRAPAAGRAESPDRPGHRAEPQSSGELSRPVQSEAQLVGRRDR